MRRLNPLPLPFTTEEIARFHARYLVHDDGCWPWLAGQGPDGYGQFSVHRNGKRILLPAHRMAYFLEKGVDAYPLLVLHTCDNPPCVKPIHFFTGTDADNSADKVSKGRQKGAGFGSRNPAAKLSEDQVREIRKLQGAASQTVIAAQFGVNQTLISMIFRRVKWGYLDQ